MSAIFPALLASHVILALSLVLPTFLLAFTLRTHGTDGDPVISARPRRVTRVLLWLESNGTVVIGTGVALTGTALLLLLGGAFLERPWLLLALALYAAILLVSFFVQRPGLRRLLRLPDASSEGEKERWRVRARRQRYISYAMGAGLGLIAWLMMAKPGA